MFYMILFTFYKETVDDSVLNLVYFREIVTRLKSDVVRVLF